MLSELYEDKLFQTRIHFKTILEEGFRIIKENDNTFNVYCSLFKRYIYCLDTINLLIADFNFELKHREQSIAIVLRASLLDYLTTLYLRTYYAEKKAEVKSLKSTYDVELDKLLSDQLKRILTVSKKNKQTSAYNHESFCKTVDNIYNNFKSLFDESIPIDYENPSKSLKYSSRNDEITNSEIRVRLDNFSKNLKGIDYLHVFSLYDIYSKYDHFGVMSMLLENMDINEVCENMLWSIFHITDGISFCVDLLRDEVGCKSDFEKMLNEIDYLRGVIYTRTFWLSKEYKEKNQ